MHNKKIFKNALVEFVENDPEKTTYGKAASEKILLRKIASGKKSLENLLLGEKLLEKLLLEKIWKMLWRNQKKFEKIILFV